MAGPAKSETRIRASSPERRKAPDVSPEAFMARVNFFFAGIGDLHRPIDRDYSVGHVTSFSEDHGEDDVMWLSEFRVNGSVVASIRDNLKGGEVWDTEYALTGVDEDGNTIYMDLEVWHGESQGVDISKRIRNDYQDIDIDLDEDQDLVIFETVQVEDFVERARIARRLGVKV